MKHAFLFALLASTSAYAAEGLKVGVVGLATGSVTGIEGGHAHALKTGEDIHLGEVVKTAGGQAQLIFLDRSTLTLKAGSDITIDRFAYDPDKSSGSLALESAKGAFRFIGGALSKKQPVEIATPTGTIGIRGGIVDGSISASGETGAVFVYGDAMTIQNAGGTARTTTYGAGFNIADADTAPQAMSATQLAAHFDGFRGTTGGSGSSAPSSSGGLDLGTEAHAPIPAGEHASSPAANSSQPNIPSSVATTSASPLATPTVDTAQITTVAGNTQIDRAVHDDSANVTAPDTASVSTPPTTPNGASPSTPPSGPSTPLTVTSTAISAPPGASAPVIGDPNIFSANTADNYVRFNAAVTRSQSVQGVGNVAFYDTNSSTATNTPPNVAVDWNKSIVLGATANFLGTPSASVGYGTVTPLASVGSSTNQYMAGETFSLNPDSTTEAETLSVDKSIYGNATDGINRFIIKTGSDTTTATRIAAPSTDMLAAATQHRFSDPVLQSQNAIGGFAGGLLVQNISAGNAGTVDAYLSGDGTGSGGVDVTFDGTANTTDATLYLDNVDGGHHVTTTFGGGDIHNGVYVSDKLWASKQTSQMSDAVSLNDGNGALISGAFVKDVPASARCTACQYTQWGVWGAEAKNGASRTDLAPLVPVLVGQVTQTLPSTGTATYNGPAYANVQLDNGAVKNAVGTMTAGVDFGSRALTNMAINLPVDSSNAVALNLPAAYTIPAGDTQFTGVGLNVTRNGNNVGGTSRMNGAFFGPNAEEIGGSYAASSTSVKVGGIFQGKR